MNEDQLDQLAAMRAEVDQLKAMAPVVAEAAWGIYNAFRAEGFSEKHSIYMVATLLKGTPGEPPS